MEIRDKWRGAIQRIVAANGGGQPPTPPGSGVSREQRTDYEQRGAPWQAAAHDKELLRALETVVFPAGETVWGGDPEMPVLIQPERYGGRPNLHMIAIGIHPPVRPVLRRLACGVFDRSGQLAAAGRTDANGVLWIDLTPGEYHLRCVDDVCDETDCQILQRIGDRVARSQLEIARENQAIVNQPSHVLLVSESGGTANVEQREISVSQPWRRERVEMEFYE